MSGYRVIYADPPWQYNDRKVGDGWRGTPYKAMPLAELATLPVRRIAAPDCALFLWATGPLIREALATATGWGFEFKTFAFEWVKLNRKNGLPFFGLGRWTRGNLEHCLLCTRGKPRRLETAKAIPQLVLQAPIGEHSAKPDIIADKIVELMGDVPRIELFARKERDGWDTTGLECDGFDIRDLLNAAPSL